MSLSSEFSLKSKDQFIVKLEVKSFLLKRLINKAKSKGVDSDSKAPERAATVTRSTETAQNL